MGLTAPGEGHRAIEEGWVEKGGRLPVNPSGGLKSKGHPVGATGVSMHVMAALQLTGEAEGMQVEGRRARRHLQHGRRGGGELRVDPGAAAVASSRPLAWSSGGWCDSC